jgi:hypothetical protein
MNKTLSVSRRKDHLREISVIKIGERVLTALNIFVFLRIGRDLRRVQPGEFLASNGLLPFVQHGLYLGDLMIGEGDVVGLALGMGEFLYPGPGSHAGIKRRPFGFMNLTEYKKGKSHDQQEHNGSDYTKDDENFFHRVKRLTIQSWVMERKTAREKISLNADKWIKGFLD